jgi:NAD(P)-dependent dehydrogenase (short-subunit alcohol dehydrogenase family)
MNKTVLVTGAAGGLGAATADAFAARGWHVFAGDITPPAPAPNRTPITLDVTDSESCSAAARDIAAHTNGLGAVINFAGLLDLGPMMEVSEERLERILAVNVVGTHRVNRAMFALIQAGRGRIVNISSAAGRFRAGPTSGPYATSKHAVEAYSDALRQELMFVDVPVIVIEPGSFHSPMSQSITGRLASSVPPGSPFEPLVTFVTKMAGKDEKNARDPAVLADAVYRAVVTKRPKPRYLVNGGSVQNWAVELLPRTVVDRIIKAAVR